MEDSFRHQGLRKQLVEQLAEKGIHNTSVLEAINKIPIKAIIIAISVGRLNSSPRKR